MLLLESNPLENIEHTQSIVGIVKNGTYYSNDSIKVVLEKLSRIYVAVDSIIRSIEQEIDNENIDQAVHIYTSAKNKYPDQPFMGYYTMWYAGYRFLYENRALTENPERADLALKFYQMYLQEYPNMHGSHYLLGMAYKAQKDTLNAVKSFEASLRIHPFNPYARNQLEQLK